jgi:hypothetical protein
MGVRAAAAALAFDLHQTIECPIGGVARREWTRMIATQLSAELEQRAGSFLAAAQFAADPGHLRTASLIGAAARIARTYGTSGVEGYLAAMGDIGTDSDRIARHAIRDALDAAIVRIAADAWLGRLSAPTEGVASAA